MEQHFFLLISVLLLNPSCLLVNGQFSTAVKETFQIINDEVFMESRCRDRTRCMMSEWDYVKELTNDLDDQFVGPRIVEEPGNWYFNKFNTDPIHFASFVCKSDQDWDSVVFYKWYQDGVEVQVTDPANAHISMAGGRLDINNPTEEDSGAYYCSATNVAGTAISRTRNLYAAYVGDFDQTEREVVVSANQVAIIECKYSQDYFKRLDFFWKRQILESDGTLLEEEEFIQQSNRFIIDENNGNLYLIKPNRADLNRIYRCVVRNEKEYEQEVGEYEFVEGPPITVTNSRDLPTLNDIAIKYPTEDNKQYSVRATRNITMYCVADGGHDLLTYTWSVPSPEIGNYFYRFGGAKLEINYATLDNNGEYMCTVRNLNREVSVTMELYVYERPIITIPAKDREARAGEDFVLSCEASGEPAPGYRWYYNGKEINPGAGLAANGNSLAFFQVTSDLSGIYQCEAYNEHGNAISTSQVRIDDVEPFFISQFQFRVDERVVFQEGYPGYIKCKPFAIPIPKFSWNYNNEDIVNGTKYQMWLDGTLLVNNVNLNDNGDYKCLAQGTGNSEDMSFVVVVIPKVQLEVSEGVQTTLVNRTVDLKCDLTSDNPSDGRFAWFLNGVLVEASLADNIIEIEQAYRRLDKAFGSDDLPYKIQNDKTFAMNTDVPYFYPNLGPTANPFYPQTGPGTFRRSDADNTQRIRSESEWMEVRKWDPYNPYKTQEQYEKELQDEKDIILRFYGTDISWYVEAEFQRKPELHFIMVGSTANDGTLRLYRPQKWQQGEYQCCYITLYGQTCKAITVSIIDRPPEPSNVIFNTAKNELSWGNPNRRNSDSSLPITKFVIEAEITALYPVPELMTILPMDDSYSPPGPFFPVEGAFLPTPGFHNITEVSVTNNFRSKIDLSDYVHGYCTMRFRVISINAIGSSLPSLPTVELVMPQSKPTAVIQNIRAGFALRATSKRLLAIAFDPVSVSDFGADNCYFNVFYRKTGSGSQFKTEKMRSPFQSQITIQLPIDESVGRDQVSDYDVQLQIVNDEGEGPMSDIVLIKEVPLPSTQVVTDVKVVPTSGTSVLITFNGIDLTKEPTFAGYQVEAFKYNEDDFDVTNNFFEVSEGNSTRFQEINLFDLEPSMNYKFKVRVINGGGYGTPSEQVFGETYMAQPSEQPQNVGVYTYKEHGSVRVMWDPITVKDGEAQLEGYYVFYWKHGIPDNESDYYVWRREAEYDEETFIRNLEMGERYYAIVQPFSEGGFGVRSEPFPFLMRETAYNELYMSECPGMKSTNALLASILSILALIKLL